MDGGPGSEPTGVPPPVPPPYPPLPPPPLTGWGPQPEDPRLRQAWTKIIIALVLAPLGLVACNILGIPAVVLAGLALSELRRVEEVPSHYRVLAIVAIVLGGLGALLLLGTVVLFLFMWARQGSWP